MWTPMRESELADLLSAQVAALYDDDRRTYDRYRVGPYVAGRVFSMNPDNPVPTFVVAQASSTVLFYDDIEEEWGTAEVPNDKRIIDWGTWGDELRWALRNFPIPAALR
jgi:hypothetical protein